MDSSSESSFAWTAASDDSSDSDMAKKKVNHSDDESDFGKDYKKKLQERLFSENGAKSPPHAKVKPEPASDLENKPSIKADNSDAYDESFLNSKVKSEDSFAVPAKAKKKKKKSMSVCFEEEDSKSQELSENNNVACDDSSPEVSSVVEHESDTSAKKKKKKKKSRRKSSGSEAENDPRQLASESAEPPTSPEPMDISHVATNGDITKHKKPAQLPNSSRKRIPRISDRLQFEDDTDTHASDEDSPRRAVAYGTKLAKFIESNGTLKRVSGEDAGAALLSADDDVWLVRCPRDVAAEHFRGKRWTLDGRYKIKLGARVHIGELCAAPAAALLRPGGALARLDARGLVRLRRKLPEPADTAPAPAERVARVPLPPTARRHPLLGAQFERALRLPAPVAERLRAAREPRAAKKRKRPREEPCAPKDSPAPAEDYPAPRRKRARLSSRAWDSEKAIEENLFNF